MCLDAVALQASSAHPIDAAGDSESAGAKLGSRGHRMLIERCHADSPSDSSDLVSERTAQNIDRSAFGPVDLRPFPPPLASLLRKGAGREVSSCPAVAEPLRKPSAAAAAVSGRKHSAATLHFCSEQCLLVSLQEMLVFLAWPVLSEVSGRASNR